MNKKINTLIEIFTNKKNNDLAQACRLILRTKNKHELEIAINEHTIDLHKFKEYKKIILDNFSDFDNECLGLSIDTSRLMKELKFRD